MTSVLNAPRIRQRESQTSVLVGSYTTSSAYQNNLLHEEDSDSELTNGDKSEMIYNYLLAKRQKNKWRSYINPQFKESRLMRI